MKKASIGLLIFGVCCIIISYILGLFAFFEFLSQDGLLLFGIMSVLCGAVLIIFNNFFEKHSSLKSLGMAMGISLFAGFGLNCLIRLVIMAVFPFLDDYPIDLTVSLFVGFLSLVGFIVLFSLYIMYRSKKPSLKGVLVDVSFGLVYVIPFLFVYSLIYELCAGLFHYYFPNL